MKFDRDRSGYVSLDEMERILAVRSIKISAAQRAALEELCAGSGRLDYVTFTSLFEGDTSGNLAGFPWLRPPHLRAKTPLSKRPPRPAAHMDFGREQLVKYLRNQMEMRWGPANYRSCFLSYDRDRSGFISLRELQQILSVNNIRINVDTLADICGVRTDDDGEDGRISFRGLVELLNSVPSGNPPSHSESPKAKPSEQPPPGHDTDNRDNHHNRISPPHHPGPRDVPLPQQQVDSVWDRSSKLLC